MKSGAAATGVSQLLRGEVDPAEDGWEAHRGSGPWMLRFPITTKEAGLSTASQPG